MSDASEPSQPKPPYERHLWEITAVRDLLALILILLAAWLTYALRAVLAPLLLALALAYIAEPVVRGGKRRLHLPRMLTALILLVFFIAALSAFVIWLMPHLVAQVDTLAERLPAYWNTLQRQYVQYTSSATTQPTASETAVQTIEPTLGGAFDGFNRAWSLLGVAVGTAIYIVVVLVLTPILFVSFATHFHRLADLKAYLPRSQRDHIWNLLRKVDQAFNGYVRGQLVVALFTTAGFCIGFYLVGVPYWFVVALIGGILSLIPYGQCTGWLLAIVLQYVDAQTAMADVGWVEIVLLPSLVYLVTQSMETWVITPLVQGEAVNLPPIVVMVVLIAGGTLAGLIGLVLAIPVTASAIMLFHELGRPRLRRWADTH